ncbi:MazG nucleotide pyrophosphohydrolase domain-containing protein [Ferrimicrobium sp.]|uniref:MazG nucleotide pyrophosphohydrolase domain-containing protein n=1 Tax=Ferrimicrobium sp. TaxID=2926050 RepID=UPI0026350783|nr:MazG nucleotide pyrophosphohydrolase domain-containing protein [Ferrimicrobium sp.]
MQSTIVLIGAGIATAMPQNLAAALDGCTTVVCRTLRHPGLSEALASAVDPTVPILSCDDLYDRAENFDDLYPLIVQRLVDLSAIAGNTRIAYVVPGSPAIGERSVQLLLTEPRVAVEIGDGLGLLDYVALRLHIDPIDGLKIVDAIDLLEDFPSDGDPLLALQCFDPMIATEITAKATERGGEVTLLHHLGLPDEQVLVVDDTSAALQECDHLTSLLITNLEQPFAQLVSLIDIVHRLRQECPWDAEQTHRSLARHLLEEAHEVVQAIDDLELAVDQDPSLVAHLKEELGDLLLQVLMHTEIGSEDGDFTLESVAGSLREKLIRRHPHVFGAINVDSAEQVVANWETIKAEERKASTPAQVPQALPGALRLQKAYRKVTGLGLSSDDLMDNVQATSASTPDSNDLVVAAFTALSKGVDLEETLRYAARALEGLMPQ